MNTIAELRTAEGAYNVARLIDELSKLDPEMWVYLGKPNKWGLMDKMSDWPMANEPFVQLGRNE